MPKYRIVPDVSAYRAYKHVFDKPARLILCTDCKNSVFDIEASYTGYQVIKSQIWSHCQLCNGVIKPYADWLKSNNQSIGENING